MASILTLENDHIRANLNDDGSAELVDKTREVSWRMGAVAYQEEGPVDVGHWCQRGERGCCEQYPGRFKATVKGNVVHYTLFERLGREMGTFQVVWRLQGAWLDTEIKNIDEKLPNLMFPTPIECDALVLPQGAGKIVRESTGYWMRYIYRNLSMRWFGGLRGENGWMAVLHEGYADAGALHSGMCITPLWLKSLGRWNSPRTVRYGFTGNGYVGMAKTFRRYAQEHDLFLTLEEKIKRTPALRHLIGGRFLSVWQSETFDRRRSEDSYSPIPERLIGKKEGVVAHVTHAQAAAIFNEAKALGMRNGMFGLHGWGNGGYDERHPDIWPPEPALGSVDELAAVCREKEPYLTYLHDNYADIYEQSPSFPNGVLRTRDGQPLPAGFWAGGQAYLLNYKHTIKSAQRNWQHLRKLGVQSIYVDTTTASAQFLESWNPDDLLTRSEDEHYRKEFLAWWKAQGLIVASENGSDWAVPYVDWVPCSPHTHASGINVPLWSLVYHDCQFNMQNALVGSWPMKKCQPDQIKKRALLLMLWGYVPNFTFSSKTDWDACKDDFANTFYIDAWVGRIATSEMTNHRFLSSDYLVEQTEFANGLAITVNFGKEPVKVDGIEIPALGYVQRT